MPRKSPTLTIIEHPGNLHPDLKTAQRQALPALANDLSEMIRALLVAGVLVQENGRILPNQRKENYGHV